MPRVTNRPSSKSGIAHRPHDGPCRGLIGVRCSTDEQLEQYGPKVQTDACLAIADRESLAVDAETDVVVISQSVTKYVGADQQQALDGDFYAAIIERLKTGRYCAYLTYDMTRLTRSGVLHQLLLEQEVERHVPRILYANLVGVDTSTPEGETFKVIMAAVNRLRTVLDMARLTAAKRRQALAGYWVCETLPIGYALEADPAASAGRKRPAYRRIPYPPHAAVVTAMLRALVDARGNPFRAAVALRRDGVVVPPFGEDIAALMTGRSALDRMGTRGPGGWAITPRMITGAARNPAYEGVLTWDGQEILRDPRLAVIDRDLIGEARAALDRAAARPRGRAAATGREPLVLTDLLYCAGPRKAPHETPVRCGAHPAHGNYRCTRHYRNGDEGGCLAVRARMVDGPVAAFVLGQLRLGELADEVVAELEQERADGVARTRKRDEDRRRLTREIATLETNLDTILQSEVVNPDRYARLEQTLSRKRAAFAALPDDEPAAPIARHLDAHQVATVRALLDNLEAIWPTMSGTGRNDLLSQFLERVELRHDGRSLSAHLRWITGREQTLLIERPRYRSPDDARWTEEDDEVLRALYAGAPWEEIAAAVPGRSHRAIATRARRLGLVRAIRTASEYRRQPPYSAEEDALVRRYAAGELMLEDVCARTGRSTFSVFVRVKRLGLRRQGPRSVAAPRWREVDEFGHECTNDGRSSRPATTRSRTAARRSRPTARRSSPARPSRPTPAARSSARTPTRPARSGSRSRRRSRTPRPTTTPTTRSARCSTTSCCTRP
jgi:DNA invertase Pin-like site-specific DNA recombinase